MGLSRAHSPRRWDRGNFRRWSALASTAIFLPRPSEAGVFCRGDTRTVKPGVEFQLHAVPDLIESLTL